MPSGYQSPPPRVDGAVQRAGKGDRKSLSPLARTAVALLRLYKLAVSPLLPSACRFYPSCSDYMREAVERHGAWGGMWMGIKRLARCHPFHPGGFDPVR
ncbi:MAG: membrane protein insertion efficiency factor YidD [Bryobacterales bacterium]|nr:membrane protein insertion efficiency factor YidD [Bryobacterales bacterium]